MFLRFINGKCVQRSCVPYLLTYDQRQKVEEHIFGFDFVLFKVQSLFWRMALFVFFVILQRCAGAAILLATRNLLESSCRET